MKFIYLMLLLLCGCADSQLKLPFQLRPRGKHVKPSYYHQPKSVKPSYYPQPYHHTPPQQSPAPSQPSYGSSGHSPAPSHPSYDKYGKYIDVY